MEDSPGAPLKVFALWTEKLLIDSRSRWDAAGLGDPRVDHLWDESNLAGEWLAANAGAPSDWDFYMLFGPEAEWTDKPAPLLASGATVLGDRKRLLKSIEPLLEPKELAGAEALPSSRVAAGAKLGR